MALQWGQQETLAAGHPVIVVYLQLLQLQFRHHVTLA